MTTAIKYADLKARGVCTQCWQRPKTDGFLSCRECRECKRLKLAEVTRHCKAVGLCRRCRQKPVVVGTAQCADCAREHIVNSAYRRSRLKASGLCIQCGYNKPRRNRVTCEACHTRQYQTPGKCHLCSHPLMPNSSSLCRKHWFREAARRNLNDQSVAGGAPLEALLIKQGYKCPYTGRTLVPGVNCWLDHILPVSRFPDRAHDITNVEWVDKEVNISKCAMTRDEYLAFCRTVVAKQEFIPSDALLY